MELSREAVAAWLSASCAEQGVPVLVTDPHVLAKVAALLSSPTAASDTTRSTVPSRSRGRSQAPDRPNTGRVQGTAARLTGSDDGVVENR
ncbi:hypothetical protein GCM10023328_35430 [Modestobacter marinus]|uniref:Uncharacterized protein n=1 Tax=Modestobacter marinus TaxID=477641 RepID=A0ABQ2G3E3_9ACTN|nr:hypothetical protein GCM10011589_32120 [Modestobacter marinus]